MAENAQPGGDDGRLDHQGVAPGFDRGGDGHGFQDVHGFGPGGPQLGQAPDGQVPGMRGQDDGRQDGGTDSSNT
jgi:hypothetical protein